MRVCHSALSLTWFKLFLSDLPLLLSLTLSFYLYASIISFRYYTHNEAVDCMRLISGTKLDERVIRCDLDPGYKDGRQYGRGRSGGQVRDEYRQEYDAGRGGWGHNRIREDELRRLQEEEDERRRKALEEIYREQEGEEGGRVIPQGGEGDYEEWEGKEREDERDWDGGRRKDEEDGFGGEKRGRENDDDDSEDEGEDGHQVSRRKGGDVETYFEGSGLGACVGSEISAHSSFNLLFFPFPFALYL